MVLRKLADDAAKYLGEKVTEAVITVPAYFNDAQRQATKDAGKIAGLNVQRIINEPTAAALAYGLDKKGTRRSWSSTWAGARSTSRILDVGEGVFEVTVHGRGHAPGRGRLRQAARGLAGGGVPAQPGHRPAKDRQALQRLTEAAEKAKIELSSVVETTINLPFITADASGPKHLDMALTRAKFEQLTADLVERCAGPVGRRSRTPS